MGRRLVLAVVAGLLASATASALTLESQPHRVRLLELYTSEGCSSCPPADRWLSTFTDHAGLWTDIVPAAFHVDYWNYLGWKDRFARAEYSARQRDYAFVGATRAVYTPGLFVDGGEWRGWFGGERDIAPPNEAAAVKLQLVLDGRAGTLRVTGTTDKAVASVALLGFDQVTEVRRGENRGKELRHDFVVLEFHELELKVDGDAHTAAFELATTRVDDERYAIAAWVTEDRLAQPLQVVGGWLNRPVTAGTGDAD